MEHVSRVLAMVRDLGRRALAMASAGEVRLPHDPPRGGGGGGGERWWVLTGALPAARVLLGEGVEGGEGGELRATAESLDEALAGSAEGRGGGGVRVVDAAGQARPVYPLLAMHLFRVAGRDQMPPLTISRSRVLMPDDLHPALRLWHTLAHADADADESSRKRLVTDNGPALPAPLHPLHPREPDENLDAWTYRELIGLHALHRLGRIDETRRVARWHQQHTQPDYTTYQPWGLAAFASSPETVAFAEQQLHDVETHLALGGAGGAVVPALLLADAAAVLRLCV